MLTHELICILLLDYKLLNITLTVQGLEDWEPEQWESSLYEFYPNSLLK